METESPVTRFQTYTERGSIMEGVLRLLSCTKAAADLFLISGQEGERTRCFTGMTEDVLSQQKELKSMRQDTHSPSIPCRSFGRVYLSLYKLARSSNLLLPQPQVQTLLSTEKAYEDQSGVCAPAHSQAKRALRRGGTRLTDSATGR